LNIYLSFPLLKEKAVSVCEKAAAFLKKIGSYTYREQISWLDTAAHIFYEKACEHYDIFLQLPLTFPPTGDRALHLRIAAEEMNQACKKMCEVLQVYRTLPASPQEDRQISVDREVSKEFLKVLDEREKVLQVLESKRQASISYLN